MPGNVEIMSRQEAIIIKNARLNNLKNISVNIPRNQLVVITGLSGSGKSTLIFDTLHKESQRQFMGAQGIVTDGLQKPAVDAIEGLSPSIAIDQHLSNHNPRSTVGTATEVYTYLRVLYARIGHRPCPVCGNDVPPAQDEAIAEDTGLPEAQGEAGETSSFEEGERYPCPHCQTAITRLTMAHFSFNTPAGACPTCTGLGSVREVDAERIFDPDLSILAGGVRVWDQNSAKRYAEILQNAARRFDIPFDVATPIGQYTPALRALLLHGVHSRSFRQFAPHIEPPTTVAQGNFEGIATSIMRRYEERADDPDYRADLEKLLKIQTCSACAGRRLRPESLLVTVNATTIDALSQLPLSELMLWLQQLPEQIAASEHALAKPILDDLSERVKHLVDVGIGYLTLDRGSPGLSGGEAQRLRLAALLGSGLTGVLYILDEPTTGLHPRDTVSLISTLKRLRDLGNTVIVIEHDLEMMRAADHIIEVGPLAGERGGQIVATGSTSDLIQLSTSITGAYLSGKKSIPSSRAITTRAQKVISIQGARAHNLKNVSVNLPLGTFTAITGVSGSGKSSLILDILGTAARRRFDGSTETPGEHDAIHGWEYLTKAITIDQEPIGRSPRSNPATYIGIFTTIRQTFAATRDAYKAGLTARHFSFNVPGGRCERCEGAGVLSIHMHFLPAAIIRCSSCQGKRFTRQVLAATYRGYTIADVLEMTVDEALPLFEDISTITHRLSLLSQVGLGYVRLGQPATTLSGGEAQRIKLATELARRSTGHTLYLLDEPTNGLHIDDTAHLLQILHRLVQADNTVIVIEHNIDVIKTADWIVDMGPEGGASGGSIIVQGTPWQVAQCEQSYTGRFLREVV